MGRKKIDISKEELIKLHYEDGMSQSEIGRLYNCSSTAIKNHMRKHGLKVVIRHKVSEETKRKIGEKAKKRYRDNPDSHPTKGRKQSEETKRKIGEKAKKRFKDNPDSHPMKGREISEEEKKKMSERQIEYFKNNSDKRFGIRDWVKKNPHPMLGKHHSEEAKQKIRDKAIGRKASKETRAKISASNMGREPSKETREKLSRLAKERFKNNPHPCLGRKMSERHKSILSKLKLGVPRSEETKAKLSAAHKGKKLSEEHKTNIGKAGIGRIRSKKSIEKVAAFHRGRKRPKETGQKISKKAKIRWEDPNERLKFSEMMKKRYEDGWNPLVTWAKENPDYMIGKNNPRWKGGIARLPYAPIFGVKRYKDLLWARHGEVCMNPDCSGDHLDKSLFLHHIDHDKLNTWPENLIGVCCACNAMAESKETWDYYIELYQGITSELNNQKATKYYNRYYTYNFLDFENSSQEDDLSLLEAVNQ